MKSMEKALEYAKLFEKPILCFVDSALTDAKRGEMAVEFFSHPTVYKPFSSNYIFMSVKHIEGVEKGVVLFSSEGKRISSIENYYSLESLVKTILKEDFNKIKN